MEAGDKRGSDVSWAGRERQERPFGIDQFLDQGLIPDVMMTVLQTSLKMDEKLITAVSGFPWLCDLLLFVYHDVNKKRPAPPGKELAAAWQRAASDHSCL